MNEFEKYISRCPKYQITTNEDVHLVDNFTQELKNSTDNTIG